MYDDLILRLRDAAKMSEALAVLLPHSEGNATAKLYNEAVDAIEKLSKRIPVPPHGRLIDADSKTFPTLHRNPTNDYMKGWNACLRSVQQQPTIIPAEEGE